MTGLVIAWVLFPLVLGGLSLGCGLLVEAASGIRLRGTLLLPTGFAAMIIVAQLVTLSASSAPFTPWVVVGVALAGLVLTRPWRDRRPDRWPTAAGVVTFAAYGAPVVLSGSATFAGWLKLDDGATWLAIADRLMTHGRSLAGVPSSTYLMNIQGYLGSGYPVGAYLPLGVGSRLVDEELAWLLQPYIAFAAAMLALAVYGLVSRVIGSPALGALAAFVPTQSALLFGYSLWGGVKEVVGAALIASSAALLPTILEPMRSPRAAIPLAVATAATLESLSVTGGLVWLGPLLFPAVLFSLRRHRPSITLRVGAGLAIVATLLAIPAIAVAVKFYNSSRSILTSSDEVATLLRPLKFEQIVGIWPAGDFRFDPLDTQATYLLIAIAALSSLGGALYALRARAPEVALYSIGSLVSATVVVAWGSPWVDGKAMTIASPAILTAAAVGAIALLERGRRARGRSETLVGSAALVATVAGVLWCTGLAYHDVRLAPRDQLEELATIGERPPEQGPALMLEPTAYGLLYFLRDLAPENPSMRRSRQFPLLLNGRVMQFPAYADIDAFVPNSILPYRTLVLNRAANASRPPSIYRLVWEGRYYEVWQRPEEDPAPIVAHLAANEANRAVAVPSCSAVRDLASRARQAGATVKAALRSPPIIVSLSRTRHPQSWKTYSDSPNLIYPQSTGTLTTTVTVPARGTYGVWLGGSFLRALEIFIDGTSLGKQRHRLNNVGGSTPFGEIELAAGRHDVRLEYTAANLYPGSGGITFLYLGPLVLGRQTANVPVTTVEPANASSVCGKSVDWIEVVQR